MIHEEGIKDSLKVKLEKTQPDNRFNNKLLPGMPYPNKTWESMKKEEINWLRHRRFLESFMLKIVLNEHILNKVIWKSGRVKDLIVQYQKQNFCKVHKQQVGSCICQLAFKRL